MKIKFKNFKKESNILKKVKDINVKDKWSKMFKKQSIKLNRK